jgi:hypothetical protein
VSITAAILLLGCVDVDVADGIFVVVLLLGRGGLEGMGKGIQQYKNQVDVALS